MRILVSIFCCLLVVATLHGQKNKREPLTQAQIDKIAEAGIDPNERVRLYTQYLDNYANSIKALAIRVKSDARSSKLNNMLLDVASLQDELADNLDTLADRKADIRKSLKALNEASQRWQNIFRALIGEPGFDLARKEAIESGEDLAGEAKRLSDEQEAYFKLHPDEVGQDRWEPK